MAKKIRFKTDKGMFYAWKSEEGSVHFEFYQLMNCSDLVKDGNHYSEIGTEVLKVYKNKALVTMPVSGFYPQTFEKMKEAYSKLS